MARSRPNDLVLGKFAENERTFIGELQGNRVTETKNSCMMDIMESGVRRTRASHSLDSLRILMPVDRPSKIICIGLNYRSHIKEMKRDTPKNPIIFTKPSSALVGPGDGIMLPKASSRIDYEGESALIIGRRATNVKNGALHIFGYTCFNDVTARDLQEVDVDWTRSKGFDTFAPVGPFISTRCPSRITTRLNGRVVQNAPLSDRVFNDRTLVEYVSGIMTLEPGDIIATGTPSGISPMRNGDIVEVELDTVGTLTNQVVQPP